MKILFEVTQDLWLLAKRVTKVLDSCSTPAQFATAQNYAKLADKKLNGYLQYIMDYQDKLGHSDYYLAPYNPETRSAPFKDSRGHLKTF